MSAAATGAVGPGDASGVITPDAVSLAFEHATVGSRGVARLIDTAIVWAGLVVLSVAELSLRFSRVLDGGLGLAFLLVLVFLWQLGYPVAFETLWRGRTPGKAVMGLRVVTVEGAPIGLRHATLRAVTGVVELTASLGAIAVLTALITRRGQRLGDLAAGTVVLREGRHRRPGPAAQDFVAPVGLEGYVRQLDVSAVDAATYATVRGTLLRAPQLPHGARAEVTTAVATRLVDRVRPGPPAGVPAEQWLTCVAAAVQARGAPPGPSRAAVTAATPPPPPRSAAPSTASPAAPDDEQPPGSATGFVAPG